MVLKRSQRSYTVFLLLLTIGLVVGYLFELPIFRILELRAFDRMSALRPEPGENPVVIVAIDDQSIDRKGGWPWPRSDLAEVIEKVSAAGSSAIGLHLLFPEKAVVPGLDAVRQVREALGNPKKRSSRSRSNLIRQIKAAESRLDQDQRLIRAVRSARNIVLPLRFVDADAPPADPRGQALIRIHSMPSEEVDKGPVALLSRWTGGASGRGNGRFSPSAVISPYEDLSGKAGGLGHVNPCIDVDGISRSISLLMNYEDRLIPSLALQLALKASKTGMRSMSLPATGIFGRALEVGSIRIPTDRFFRFYIDSRPLNDRFTTVSFADVQEGQIPDSIFRNRVVLIGPTSARLTDSYPRPFGRWVAPVQFSAALVDGLLGRNAVERPGWAAALELGFLVYVAFFLWLVIPRVQLRVGGLILATFLVTWLGAAALLFKFYGYWLYLFPPLVLALLGFMAAVWHQKTEQLHQRNVELARTLAVAYLTQGQLEMAAQQLLACPAEDRSLREPLYQLGEELERKRLYERALEVYDHLLKAGRYKDARQRVRQLKVAEKNGVKPNGPTIVLTNGRSQPTFGRYEILSELGQGAMGKVFLGKDPKINREVAIKTLDYRSIPSVELDDMKARFFREAEAAGNLSHPTIVTIYDVGEEHDMAYMAMELLEGGDLTAHCREGSLLPIKRVVEVMAMVADALDYAHGQGVVHRDIKPANIMLLNSGEVKVADFGIARIMDSSTTKTKTGIVLGTPYYMSPEQVAGKRVDGRSDLFSMGVVFYELLTGKRPFSGESMTALMYAISKTPHTPLMEVAPDLPECCVSIVERLLSKGVTRRYKSAGVLVQELKDCLSRLKG